MKKKNHYNDNEQLFNIVTQLIHSQLVQKKHILLNVHNVTKQMNNA